MKFIEVTKYYWKSKDSKFVIQEFSYRTRNGQHHSCAPYFNAYRSHDGRRIYRDGKTFEDAVRGIQEFIALS